MDALDVAVLGRDRNRDDPVALRFRGATSLLDGRRPQERVEALDPSALPHIAGPLERIGDLVAAIAHGRGGGLSAPAISTRADRSRTLLRGGFA